MRAGVNNLCYPLYIAEVAPSDIRGTLSGVFQFATNFCAMMSYVMGILGHHGADGSVTGDWREMALFGLALTSGCAVWLACCVPESPRWLLQQGRDEAAESALTRLRASGTNSKRLIAQIKADLMPTSDESVNERTRDYRRMYDDYRRSDSKTKAGIADLFAPAARRPMLIGFVCFIGQSLTGIGVVTAYNGAPLPSASLLQITRAHLRPAES